MSAPNILIIDDEPESVEIVRTILVTKQYKVSCAYSADEGFAKLEKTGFDFPGERIHPKFLPVDEYIEKPIKPEALLEKVEKVKETMSDCLFKGNAVTPSVCRLLANRRQQRSQREMVGIKTKNEDQIMLFRS